MFANNIFLYHLIGSCSKEHEKYGKRRKSAKGKTSLQVITCVCENWLTLYIIKRKLSKILLLRSALLILQN